MTKEPPESDDRDTESVPGDEQVDEAERESFPASDPPSSWAGVDGVPGGSAGAVDPSDQH